MRWLVTAFVLLAAACGGPGNSLEGSIGESFSLDFDRAEIRRQDLQLIIEYIKEPAQTRVCKVVVDTERLPLDGGAVVKGPVFLQFVTVSRIATVGGDFPDVKSGEIRFEQFNFTQDGKVSGQFDVLFTTGRTLHGNFENAVQVVPLH
jgi:hypothetical protein